LREEIVFVKESLDVMAEHFVKEHGVT